jgi:ATP-dependent Clp protease adaptor protein ClpS
MADMDPSVQEKPEVVEKPEVEEQIDEDKPWKLILFNDEIHSFDEVIHQLIKALRCSQNKAEELTLKVHNEGKAVVFQGTFEECFEKNGILCEIQLVTEIKG